ncbi:hypothetical protein ACFX4I_16705 [Peribacillus sp. YIM B13472]|uniref:hypothetical protein n=1 Tax=Peribacillus sp. YIM B13472 TaxID=3366297 RepID=UPI0036716A72
MSLTFLAGLTNTIVVIGFALFGLGIYETPSHQQIHLYLMNLLRKSLKQLLFLKWQAHLTVYSASQFLQLFTLE